MELNFNVNVSSHGYVGLHFYTFFIKPMNLFWQKRKVLRRKFMAAFSILVTPEISKNFLP